MSGEALDDAAGPAATAVVSPFERAYRGLLRGLFEGRFVPGQRLAAPDLMRLFDVGRGTVREVLNRLASSGVVSIRPYQGAQVRLLTRREVGEVLDIVEVLLGLAAREAAMFIGLDGHADLLRRRHQALDWQLRADNFPTFLETREDYYRCVVGLSGNHELQRLFPAAQVHIMRVQLRHFNHAADSPELLDYIELTEAILSADPVRAETAGRTHVGFTRERVAKLPVRAFAKDE